MYEYRIRKYSDFKGNKISDTQDVSQDLFGRFHISFWFGFILFQKMYLFLMYYE